MGNIVTSINSTVNNMSTPNYITNNLKSINDLINTPTYAIKYQKSEVYNYQHANGFLSLLYLNVNKKDEHLYNIFVKTPSNSDFITIADSWRYGSNRDRLTTPDPEFKVLTRYMYDVDPNNYIYVIQQRDNVYQYAYPDKVYRIFRFTQENNKIYFHREYTKPILIRTSSLEIDAENVFMSIISGFIGFFINLGERKIRTVLKQNIFMESAHADITQYINDIANKLTLDMYNKFSINNSYINRIKFSPQINEQNIDIIFNDSLLDISSIQSCIDNLNNKINDINNFNNIILYDDGSCFIGEVKLQFILAPFVSSKIKYSLQIVATTANTVYRLKNNNPISKAEINNALANNIDLSSRLNVVYQKYSNNTKILESDVNKFIPVLNNNNRLVFNKNKVYLERNTILNNNFIKNKRCNITNEIFDLIYKISKLSIFTQDFYEFVTFDYSNQSSEQYFKEISITLSNNNYTDQNASNIINTAFNTPNKFKMTKDINNELVLIDSSINKINIANVINNINNKINDINNLNNIFYINSTNGMFSEVYFYLSIKNYNNNTIKYTLNFTKPDKRYNLHFINIDKPTISYNDNELITNQRITKVSKENENNIDMSIRIYLAILQFSTYKFIKENNKFYFVRKIDNNMLKAEKKIDITNEINSMILSIPSISYNTIEISEDKISYTFFS
jgi:hypothetical protein